MIYGLLPIKTHLEAKARLSPLLTPTERQELAWAMLQDVLDALCAAQRLDRVAVITRDLSVITLLQRYPVELIDEPEDSRSQSAAVWAGAAACQERGASAVLAIPMDAPLVQAEDLDALVAALEPAPHVVMAPAHDDFGTNGLLTAPPNAIPLHFGDDSFRKHTAEVERLGIRHAVVRRPRLALDLDSPADLVRFWAAEGDCRARDVLRGFHLDERLAAWVAAAGSR